MFESFKKAEYASDNSQFELKQVLTKLKVNDDGLIPAIAQDCDSGDVLMMAWMNRQSIEETLKTGRVCYWSRSRQCYWRKGESSGHHQNLIEMRFDCDGDAILLKVKQLGPACHTERRSCFYWRVDNDKIVMDS
jgi:phosphoribosyl-AMP cyclohydrolase